MRLLHEQKMAAQELKFDIATAKVPIGQTEMESECVKLLQCVSCLHALLVVWVKEPFARSAWLKIFDSCSKLGIEFSPTLMHMRYEQDIAEKLFYQRFKEMCETSIVGQGPAFVSAEAIKSTIETHCLCIFNGIAPKDCTSEALMSASPPETLTIARQLSKELVSFQQHCREKDLKSHLDTMAGRLANIGMPFYILLLKTSEMLNVPSTSAKTAKRGYHFPGPSPCWAKGSAAAQLCSHWFTMLTPT